MVHTSGRFLVVNGTRFLVQVYPVVNMVTECVPDNSAMGYLALLPIQTALLAARSAAAQAPIQPHKEGFDTLNDSIHHKVGGREQ